MEIVKMIEFILNNPKLVWAAASSIVALLAIITLIKFHFSKNNKFDLLKLFAYDSSTNHPSDSKVRLNAAFVVTSWAFVYLTMQDKLTEWYVAAFLLAWVADRKMARDSATQLKLNETKVDTDG